MAPQPLALGQRRLGRMPRSLQSMALLARVLVTQRRRLAEKRAGRLGARRLLLFQGSALLSIGEAVEKSDPQRSGSFARPFFLNASGASLKRYWLFSSATKQAS